MSPKSNISEGKIIDAITDLSLGKLNRGRDVYFSVLSGGMRHLIMPMDEVLVRKVPYEQIRKGDIVIYESKGNKFTAHRILSKRIENGIITFIAKADARVNVDFPIKEEQIVGKVIAVKKKKFTLRLDTSLGATVANFVRGYSRVYFLFKNFLNSHPRAKKILAGIKAFLKNN